MATKKASENKTKDKDKVFDVAKPGDSAANPTSRPVIVGHGSGLKQDPMVKPDDAQPDDTDETTAPLLTDKKVIKPITDSLNAPDKEEKPKETEAEAVQDEQAPSSEKPTDDEKDIENEDKETEDKDRETHSENAGDAAVDALAQEVNSKKESVKAEQEAKKKQAEIDKLVAEKKYVVPIGEEAHRKSHTVLYLLILIVVLVVVFLNFAIDAGLIDIGIKPLTDTL